MYLEALALIEQANLYEYENALYEKNISYIAGVDEVGRGPLAGPLVVSAVILPKGLIIEGVTDSKKLSEKKREELFEIISKKAIATNTVFISPQEVDEYNIYHATEIAMIKAVESLNIKPEHVLIDAMPLSYWNYPHTSIIKGDAKSASIAAASIIAKVTRDRYMEKMDEIYPGYGFKKHKGYPTKEHIEALNKLGVTPIHRRSYGPVRDALVKQLSFDLE